jgi:hypothetical protein
MDWWTVITSAAVGAISAAVLNIVGQALERRSRRKELLLAKAIDVAVDRSRLVFEVAKASHGSADIGDAAVYAATYYRWFDHVLRHGKLPRDAGEER